MDLRISKIGVILVALISVAAFGMFVYLVPRFGGPQLGLSNPYHVSATVPDAYGLEKSGDVWVRGVKVGTVRGLDVHGDRVTIRMDLQGRYAPVHQNATVRIGQKTPLGESYVDLSRGTARTPVIPSGGTIRKVIPTVTTDQGLRALDAPARDDISRLLATFGIGAADPSSDQHVHETLVGAAGTLHQLRMVSSTLKAQDGDISGLVRNASTVLGEVSSREASLVRLVGGGSTTLRAMAGERVALGQMFQRLPGLLSTARSTLADATPLLREARPAVADLRRAAPRLTPALKKLGPVADHLDGVLARLKPFNSVALPVLREAVPTVDEATPTVAAATTAFDQLAPIAGYVEPRRKSLAAFFSNTRAAADSGDDKGGWWRFDIFVEPTTAFGVPGGVQRNPYPKPDDALGNQPSAPGDYTRLMPFQPK